MMMRPERLRAHVRQHGLGEFHDAEDVDVVELADLLHGEIFEEAAQSHAGEMHDGVDAAGFADDGGHGAVDIRPAGHVHRSAETSHIAVGGLFEEILLARLRSAPFRRRENCGQPETGRIPCPGRSRRQ